MVEFTKKDWLLREFVEYLGSQCLWERIEKGENAV